MFCLILVIKMWGFGFLDEFSLIELVKNIFELVKL